MADNSFLEGLSLSEQGALLIAAFKERKARYPFDELVEFVGSLDGCELEVTVICADGVERRIKRTLPNG